MKCNLMLWSYISMYFCVSQDVWCHDIANSSCNLILTLQRWSTILNNSLYAYVCVFISTLFSDTLNECSLLWYRDLYQVWSFPEEKFTLVFRAKALCRPGTVIPTFWRSMLPPPVLNMKAVCLSKTWIPMYQIHSVISRKTRIWICI